MRQIDLLISEKQQELEDKVQALKTQLQCRERDLSALRVSLEQRDAEACSPYLAAHFRRKEEQQH